MYNERRSFAPVKVGDEIDVTIEGVGEKGDGIAKKEGFVLFVPGTRQGDNVTIRVTRVLRKVGFADVVGKGGKQESQQKEEEEGPSDSEEQETKQEDAPEDSEDF